MRYFIKEAKLEGPEAFGAAVGGYAGYKAGKGIYALANIQPIMEASIDQMTGNPIPALKQLTRMRAAGIVGAAGLGYAGYKLLKKDEPLKKEAVSVDKLKSVINRRELQAWLTKITNPDKAAAILEKNKAALNRIGQSDHKNSFEAAKMYLQKTTLMERLKP